MRRLLAIVILGVLALASCADGDGDEAVPLAPDEAGAAELESTTTTTPTTVAASDAVGPADGVVFVDPEGAYEVVIDPAWEFPTQELGPPGSEFWIVADEIDDFVPNVNILTQRAPGFSMEDYLTLSREQIAAAGNDASVMGQRVVEIDGDAELAVIGYAQSMGDREMQFGAVVVGLDGEFQLATFTAPAVVFADLWAEIEPYLVTLRPTP